MVLVYTWYQSVVHSAMCFPVTSTIENSSEDVFDLLIHEQEREEVEKTLHAENALFQMYIEVSETTLPEISADSFIQALDNINAEIEMHAILRSFDQ